MANFSKKERKFLIRSYRKLEILLLIFDGACYFEDIWRMLPISDFTLYKLLKTYRMQGLIKTERETRYGKKVLYFEVTDKGFRWLVYMLERECELRETRGLDVEEIDDLIDRILKKKAVEKEAEEEAERRMFPYLASYEKD